MKKSIIKAATACGIAIAACTFISCVNTEAHAAEEETKVESINNVTQEETTNTNTTTTEIEIEIETETETQIETQVENETYTAVLEEQETTLPDGWQTDENGNRSYYKSGVKVTGTQTINGNVYVFDDNGTQKTGWRNANGDRIYYSPETGEKISGKIEWHGENYYTNSKGEKQTGWINDGNDKYYYKKDYGTKTTGFTEIENDKYYFDDNGKMQSQTWKENDGQKYYFNQNGKAATGITKIGNDNYYFSPKGEMQTGFQSVNGKNYYFRTEDGKQVYVKICLDAGHYAKNNQSPAVPSYYESDMSWKLHLYLKDALEKLGVDVITTRTNQETDKPLEERGYCSRGCNLFISIHSNAYYDNTPANADYPLACCTITGKADNIGLQLAQCIERVMGTYEHARILKREGLHGDWYGVIRGAAKVGTPGMILEHSFHTNYRATMWLLNNENLKKIANAEAIVIANYYGIKA